MATGKRKKKRTGLKALLVLVAIVAIAGVLLKTVFYDDVKAKVASAVATKVIEEQIPEGVSQEQAGAAKQVYESMSDEDKEKINRLVERKVNAQTVKDVSGYVANKDKDGLKDYIKNHFSEEDIQTVMELYQKYLQGQ